MTAEKPYYMCFETVGNKLRIELVNSLGKKDMCVAELSKKVGAERSRVSHSLLVLKRCGLIKSKRDGKKQIYFLDPRLKNLLKNSTVLVAISTYMSDYCPRCGGKT